MERFEYTFNNGLQFKVALGEDGYNVNLAGGNLEQPLMGTFTSIEKLLGEVGGVIRANSTFEEFGKLGNALHPHFGLADKYDVFEMLQMLI